MNWKHLFARKDLEMLFAEMAGEHRLHRVLGPVALTCLGIGCIIGAGIFVMTGVAAADDAGPAIMVSFTIAAFGCALAAFCYAEFASMAPVAGSAYTYAYTTLGEIFAWIIGWDLILEYAMGCAAVASSWTKHLNELLEAIGLWRVPVWLSFDPFEHGLPVQPWLNLPAIGILVFVTVVLVVGIRESARTNALLVMIKLGVVLLIIVVGWGYVTPANWNQIPVARRVLPQERVIPQLAKERCREAGNPELIPVLSRQLAATYRREWAEEEAGRLEQAGRISHDEAIKLVANSREETEADMPRSDADQRSVASLLPEVREQGAKKAAASWGLLGMIGLNHWLIPLDDAFRCPFAPYGLSGIMLGAAIVFFAYIGFDSISTHAEEACSPHRDVPIGILVSLCLCTVLYITVAAVITGMIPYPQIDVNAPIAVAFAQKAQAEQSPLLRASTVLVSAGGLAGMTSVLLVLFLSQARIFMAMSRDGLLPPIFGTVHPRFHTPHIATITTGVVIAIVSALTPIRKLAEMVNVGTLMAFVIVCAAVLVLRIQRPDVRRPFRCPAIWIVAPLGMVVNMTLMLFLPLDTWLRLIIWLLIGFVVYFLYSRRHSHLVKHLLHEIAAPRDDSENGTD
jgi:amino acid transporter